MKIFHTKKIIAYPNQKLNTSEGVVRSEELSLCPLEEVKKELKPQGVTEVKRLKIKQDDKIIDTNTYTMTFDLPTIPPKIKIGYTIERCYKCHKYGHHKDKCNGRSVCGKCGDPDHTTKECKRTYRCANCGEDHPVYAETCEKWKREKEIMSVKYTRNISFQGARKIVDATTEIEHILEWYPR